MATKYQYTIETETFELLFQVLDFKICFPLQIRHLQSDFITFPIRRSVRRSIIPLVITNPILAIDKSKVHGNSVITDSHNVRKHSPTM